MILKRSLPKNRTATQNYCTSIWKINSIWRIICAKPVCQSCCAKSPQNHRTVSATKSKICSIWSSEYMHMILWFRIFDCTKNWLNRARHRSRCPAKMAVCWGEIKERCALCSSVMKRDHDCECVCETSRRDDHQRFSNEIYNFHLKYVTMTEAWLLRAIRIFRTRDFPFDASFAIHFSFVYCLSIWNAYRVALQLIARHFRFHWHWRRLHFNQFVACQLTAKNCRKFPLNTSIWICFQFWFLVCLFSVYFYPKKKTTSVSVM